MPCVAYWTTGDNGKMWSRMFHQFAEFPKSSYWIVGISKSAILEMSLGLLTEIDRLNVTTF